MYIYEPLFMNIYLQIIDFSMGVRIYMYMYIYIESKLKCNTNLDLFLEAN